MVCTLRVGARDSTFQIRISPTHFINREWPNGVKEMSCNGVLSMSGGVTEAPVSASHTRTLDWLFMKNLDPLPIAVAPLPIKILSPPGLKQTVLILSR